jgi:hypothetical protein
LLRITVWIIILMPTTTIQFSWMDGPVLTDCSVNHCSVWNRL